RGRSPIHLNMPLALQRLLSTLPLLLVAVAASFAATAAEQTPAALEIFDAALAKFEADRVALRKWQYRQTLRTQQYDSSGKVTAKGVWESIVRPGDPRSLEYTAESMEGRLSFFKAGAEEPRPAAPSTAPSPKARARADHDEKNQAESAVEAVRKYNLRDRYVWKRLPNDTASGESAYVIAFEPKPNQNTRTREERFFGQLTGKLWVSRSDYTVLRAEARLRAPAQLFWVIARVTKFRVNYNVEPDTGAGRLFRRSKATAQTVVAFPFYEVRQRHWLTMDRYEPRTPHGSHSGSARPAQ
ncbi:MAG TPA: hypothetical protein VK993_09140, partial [Chthoniobacterales bacterium]|nr:hypothetical protein [Chthoniobacterales bacterium]